MTIHRPFIHRVAPVIAAAVLLLVGCAAPSPVVAPDPGILRVGVTADAPPLIYKQNDVFTGLEADLAVKLAEYLDRTAVFVDVPWADQLPALKENRTDIIMSGLSVTTARRFDIAFSEPYFKSGLMILVKDLQKYGFIKNRETILAQSITWRVGVVEGSTGEAFVREKNIGVRSIAAYDNQQEGLDALIAGRIDVFIHDAPAILLMAAQQRSRGVNPLPVLLNEEYLAWGLRKDDPELQKAVNAFIGQSSRDGSLQTIIKRWIPLAQ